ncbi:MAG: hypothetical protein KBH71_07725 [Anaerolineae bacterium]|nr:hypothetical protein [Anaerolineae bacterium]HPD41415.1 hypothetical protein [Anaerolineae bacterium]HRT31459.1 hypothetical protein [Anaerolineae bacterium]HXK42206.1 hypothetical protein [Anaerolineae bacterium]
MSRLMEALAKLARVQERKKSRYRAYQSQALSLKLQLVERAPSATSRRSTSR